MNLPGLDFDESKYPVVFFGEKPYRKIPFADWIPPDYLDVLVQIGVGKAELMYYSPGCNMMMPSEYSPAIAALETEFLDYWLKEVK